MRRSTNTKMPGARPLELHVSGYTRLLLVALLTLLASLRGASADDPAPSDAEVAALEEQALKEAARRVAPSVVQIETIGGLEQVAGVTVGTGPTTGLVVSEDGLILSSAFNFIQMPTSILVTLPGGAERLAARIVSQDEARMLVLLKVEPPTPLPVPEIVPRAEITVGQWSIAVGRTFGAEQVSMSAGVVSATDRIWGKAIQTDAKISPINYGGPLVDIRGRVLGLLIPMSPEGKEAVAGAEWYDSGIGFAVPLDDIMRRLPQWREGKPLKPGLLGVALKGSDIYVDAAEVAASRVKSPAYLAGVRAGDKIVEVNGRPVSRQAQLKHALGPLYAGDTVHLAVQRGEERLEMDAVLVDELLPYVTPYLGVLPQRTGEGLVLRGVLPGTPAAEAGLQAGDRLVMAGDRPLRSAADLRQALAALEAGAELQLGYERDLGLQTATVKLATLPEEVPGELAPADRPEGDAPADGPARGVVEIEIVEQQNKCFAYVPDNYRGDVPHGLLVWLHAPGKFDKDALVEAWKSHCEERGLILLAPQSVDPARWTPPELEFVVKAIDEVLGKYQIDRERLAVGGMQAGGALAYMVAVQQRELVRGVVAVDAPLPRQGQLEADPVQRLAVFSTLAPESRVAKPIEAGVKRLRDAKLPVTVHDQPGAGSDLSADERAEVARWLDALDRL